MNEQLNIDLRTYMSYLESEVNSIDLDDIVRPATVIPPVRSRRKRGLAVATGAAVVTLILVGGVSLITRLQDSPVTDSVTPTTLVTPSVVVPPTIAPSEVPPTTTPATTVAPLSTQTFPVWTEVQGPKGATSEGLIVTDSSGFIYCDDLFVATSPNGIDWERTEFARPVYPVHQGQFCNAWDGIVVSQGIGGRFGGQGSGDPVVITPSFVNISRPDGDILEFRADDATVTSTVIGGTGILISTVDNRLDPALGLGLTPEEDDSVIGTTDDAGILSIHFADGSTKTVDLEAVGFDVHAGNIYKTNLWFSEDGLDWTLLPSRLGNGFGRAVGTEEGFYIGGGFTSDGLSWEWIEDVKVEQYSRLTRSGGEAILFSDETLYILSPDGLTEYVLEDLPARTVPVAGDEDGVLAAQYWSTEDSKVTLLHAIPGQPFEFEMEYVSDALPVQDHYAVFDNRFLVLGFEDGAPSFWIKDFPPN
jgi:hypothetical protein